MKQETVGNHIEHLHDETFARKYDLRNLGHSTMIHTGPVPGKA